MKKTYIIPSLEIAKLEPSNILQESNKVLGDSNTIIMNNRTMTGGDGSDAVKGSTSYDVWDDDWSKN